MKICVNLRGLRDNYMPAELAEIRRQGIYKIQGDNSYLFWKSVVCAQQFWLFLHHWIETNWFVMSKTNTYICPVCGYDKMSEPPCDDLGYPTYVNLLMLWFWIRVRRRIQGTLIFRISAAMDKQRISLFLCQEEANKLEWTGYETAAGKYWQVNNIAFLFL